MITLDSARPAAYRTIPAAPQGAASEAPRLAETFLCAALFVTVLSSFYVLRQPAPYEGLVALLGLTCIAARVPVDRGVLPLIYLLLILQCAGIASAFPVIDHPDVLHFVSISTYLSVTAVVFACLLTRNTGPRFAVLRAAYVLAAVIASLIGIGAFFKLIPGADSFLLHGRAVSTFKDPNGFGQFLVPPMLLLIERVLEGVARLRHIVAMAIIGVALLLVFSRGAWGHLAVSTLVMVGLFLLITRSRSERKRLVTLVVAAILVGAATMTALLSNETVGEMLLQRARLLQEYDIGSSGSRFNIQEKSIEEILDHPNGMGPWIFGNRYGLVSHNSYLGTLLNHGWLGGIAYLALTLVTFAAGFKASLVRTPWQLSTVAIYATFVGYAFQSLLVDTDHVRPYYLILGTVWGLIAATMRHKARAQLGACALS